MTEASVPGSPGSSGTGPSAPDRERDRFEVAGRRLDRTDTYAQRYFENLVFSDGALTSRSSTYAIHSPAFAPSSPATGLSSRRERSSSTVPERTQSGPERCQPSAISLARTSRLAASSAARLSFFDEMPTLIVAIREGRAA